MLRSITYRLLVMTAALMLVAGARTAQAENGISEGKRLFDADQFDECRQWAENELKANPQSEEGLYWLGRVAFERKEHQQSAEYFEQLVGINGANSDYQLWLGRAHGLRARHSNMLVKGRLAPKIRDAFEKAVQLDPSNIEARKGLVQYYAEAPGFLGGDPAKALEQAAAVRDLNEAEGHVAFGNVHFQAKEYDKALIEFEAAVEKGTEDAAAHASLGDIYRMNGRKDDARRLYDRALELDSDQDEALAGLKQL
jgi:tetratricopeptide (TPR) repeat protein